MRPAVPAGEGDPRRPPGPAAPLRARAGCCLSTAGALPLRL